MKNAYGGQLGCTVLMPLFVVVKVQNLDNHGQIITRLGDLVKDRRMFVLCVCVSEQWGSSRNWDLSGSTDAS